MTRLTLSARVPATIAALALLLSACGGAGGSVEVAADPGPAAQTPAPSPTESPTVGAYAAFEPLDYTYTLGIACFCANAGVPISVTVVDGEVVKAVYAADGTGRGQVEAGEPVDKLDWTSINDVIDAANDATASGAAEVRVTWPNGQDYPSSVYVDQDRTMADEEIGYQISDVVVS